MTPPHLLLLRERNACAAGQNEAEHDFFSMTYLLRAGCYGRKALLKLENASFGPVETMTREAHMTLIQAAR